MTESPTPDPALAERLERLKQRRAAAAPTADTANTSEERTGARPPTRRRGAPRSRLIVGSLTATAFAAGTISLLMNERAWSTNANVAATNPTPATIIVRHIEYVDQFGNPVAPPASLAGVATDAPVDSAPATTVGADSSPGSVAPPAPAPARGDGNGNGAPGPAPVPDAPVPDPTPSTGAPPSDTAAPGPQASAPAPTPTAPPPPPPTTAPRASSPPPPPPTTAPRPAPPPPPPPTCSGSKCP